MTKTRVAARSIRSSVCVNSSISSKLMVFICCGRVSVTSATARSGQLRRSVLPV
jgi:hypothetical protein